MADLNDYIENRILKDYEKEVPLNGKKLEDVHLTVQSGKVNHSPRRNKYYIVLSDEETNSDTPTRLLLYGDQPSDLDEYQKGNNYRMTLVRE
jgi:hypothetical protein